MTKSIHITDRSKGILWQKIAVVLMHSAHIHVHVITANLWPYFDHALYVFRGWGGGWGRLCAGDEPLVIVHSNIAHKKSHMTHSLICWSSFAVLSPDMSISF